MKPWLLNVLACPIDKHHPLEAYILKWETGESEFEKINREAGKYNPFFKKQYSHLADQISDGTISPPAITSIHDTTTSPYALELLADTRKFLNRLSYEGNQRPDALLSRFPEGIDILYRYLNLVEVEQGLLRCSVCGRWYPVGRAVESVPELMPDDLREREEELAWLQKWRDVLPDEVTLKGEPFHLEE